METFDYDVVDKIYQPYDNLGLNVILHGNGTRELQGDRFPGRGGVKAQASDPEQWETSERDFSQFFFAAGVLYHYRERLRPAPGRWNMASLCGS